jgi:FkbM family methyltransferase
MNLLERLVDDLHPGLSVRARAMKMRLRHDLTLRLIGAMLAPGEVGVDVGANRGVYTHVMSARVGRAGRVHSIEPFPGNSWRLQWLASRRGNITVHPLAVSRRAGTAVLRVPRYQGHRIDALASLEPTTAAREDRFRVPVSTLDDLLADERRVSFIKCDVEGHEQQVFCGAAKVLQRSRPVVLTELEQRHRADDIAAMFGFFTTARYRGWYVGPGGLHPLSDFDVARDQLQFIDQGFVPYNMPTGYVCDFLFCPPGTRPPSWAISQQPAHQPAAGPPQARHDAALPPRR